MIEERYCELCGELLERRKKSARKRKRSDGYLQKWWRCGGWEPEQLPLKSVPRATSCARWSRGIIRCATATARLLRALLNLVMNAH